MAIRGISCLGLSSLQIGDVDFASTWKCRRRRLLSRGAVFSIKQFERVTVRDGGAAYGTTRFEYLSSRSKNRSPAGVSEDVLRAPDTNAPKSVAPLSTISIAPLSIVSRCNAKYRAGRAMQADDHAWDTPSPALMLREESPGPRQLDAASEMAGQKSARPRGPADVAAGKCISGSSTRYRITSNV
jgi:hypothetical protein